MDDKTLKDLVKATKAVVLMHLQVWAGSDQAAARKISTCRSQPTVRFQLTLFWSTNSKSLIPKD